LGAAQRAFKAGKADLANPADPFMTLLGYFNSLRELGGARRLVEDEVGNRLLGYANRRRVGETAGLFDSRKIATDVVELTSRVSTDKVSEAKRRLGLPFTEKERVDVAIATNMISVGLDITRLGLMVVYGQPKTSAEYIQATSRVGRDHERPGLVVTLLNIHKPRDRSHYERFAAYHQSFYRSVEATSVTPFSPRALDRGLAGTLVALARLGYGPMTAARGAGGILTDRPNLDFTVNLLSERAKGHDRNLSPEEAEKLRQEVRARSDNLLDEWSKIAKELSEVNAPIQYGNEIGQAKSLLHHFLDPELKSLPFRYRKFRANRSLRDVEPSVNLWLKTMDGIDLEEEDEV
jgi:superfamily II DNA or RNA helicase